MRSSFWFSFSLIPYFRHCHFCTNDHIARMYSKISCNISSNCYGVRLQEIQPVWKFTYFFLLLNNIQMRHSHHENHLKRMPSLANSARNQPKHGFSLIFASLYFLYIMTRIDMQIIWLVSLRPCNNKGLRYVDRSILAMPPIRRGPFVDPTKIKLQF